MLELRSPLDGMKSPFGAVRGRALSPVSLFANGEPGDAWISNREWCYTKTVGGVYENVTTTGDLVARRKGMANGINQDQDDLAERPTYNEGGGLAWLETDGVNDYLFSPRSMDFSGGDIWNMTALMKFGGSGGIASTVFGSDFQYLRIDHNQLFIRSETGSSNSVGLPQMLPNDAPSVAVALAGKVDRSLIGRLDGVQIGPAFVPIGSPWYPSLSGASIGASGSTGTGNIRAKFYGDIVVGRPKDFELIAQAETYLAELFGAAL